MVTMQRFVQGNDRAQACGCHLWRRAARGPAGQHKDGGVVGATPKPHDPRNPRKVTIRGRLLSTYEKTARNALAVRVWTRMQILMQSPGLFKRLVLIGAKTIVHPKLHRVQLVLELEERVIKFSWVEVVIGLVAEIHVEIFGFERDR